MGERETEGERGREREGEKPQCVREIHQLVALGLAVKPSTFGTEVDALTI